MSTEEDTELRDLLQQTLENNGSLAKIRAELRSCVFMAVHEDEKIQAKQPLINNKIKSQLSEPEGQMLFALVHEFLEFYNMDYTLSVYKSESYLDSDYSYHGRNKLLSDLHLHENNSVPILSQLLNETLKKNVPKSNGHNHNDTTLNGTRELEEDVVKPVLNETFDIPRSNESKNNTPRSVNSDAGRDDTFEGTSSIAEDSIKEKSTVSAERNEEMESPEKSLSNGSAKLEKYKSKSPRGDPHQANKSRDFVLPSLYNSNQGFEDNLDNYEEDIMSTSEHSAVGHHGLNSLRLGNKSPLKLEKLNKIDGDPEEKVKNVESQNDSIASEISIASSINSDDFELNSAVDDILKSNSN